MTSTGDGDCPRHVEPDRQRLANSRERRHRAAADEVDYRVSFDRDRNGYCEDGHGRRDDERAESRSQRTTPLAARLDAAVRVVLRSPARLPEPPGE